MFLSIIKGRVKTLKSIQDSNVRELLEVYDYVLKNSREFKPELKIVDVDSTNFRLYNAKDLKLRFSTQDLVLNLVNPIINLDSGKIECLVNERYFNYLKSLNINPLFNVELELLKFTTKLNNIC